MKKVMKYLETVEQTLGDYQIFGNDEIDMLEERVELKI